MADNKPKLTKYQRALKASGKYCSTGSAAAKKTRDNAIKVYEKDALAKGKTQTEVNKTVGKLKGCNFIGKKKTTTKTKPRAKKK